MDWNSLVVKVLITALLITAIVELAERSTLAAAILASIPTVSVIALIWMNHEGVEAAEMAGFARGVLWLIIPSLTLFLLFPYLLEKGFAFYPSLLVGTAATIVAYFLMLRVMEHFDVVT